MARNLSWKGASNLYEGLFLGSQAADSLVRLSIAVPFFFFTNVPACAESTYIQPLAG